MLFLKQIKKRSLEIKSLGTCRDVLQQNNRLFFLTENTQITFTYIIIQKSLYTNIIRQIFGILQNVLNDENELVSKCLVSLHSN